MHSRFSLVHLLAGTLVKSFSGWNAGLHLAAIALTVGLIFSGVDWAWARFCHDLRAIQYLAVGAALVGVPAPVLVPLWVYVVGRRRSDRKLMTMGMAMGQAVIIALVVSTVCKAFAVRVAPEPFEAVGAVDFSSAFRFGFFGGGVWDSLIEGWPSGHTMTAVAMVVAAVALVEKAWVRALSLAYAVYIGLGVSATIHWPSDAVAGVLMGVAIGVSVEKDSDA